MSNSRSHHDVRYSRDNVITSTGGANNTTSDAVVLLLGWYGSKHRHLEKYSTMWETEFQCATVNVIATDEALYWNRAGLRALARDTLRISLEQCSVAGTKPPRPLIIHLFSNGGGFLPDAPQ